MHILPPNDYMGTTKNKKIDTLAKKNFDNVSIYMIYLIFCI